MAAAAVLIPVIADIAAAAAPEVFGLTLAEGLGAGALLGAGGGLLGDVVGGKSVNPLDVALGAAGGAAGGFVGAGGLGEIAGALGLGEAAGGPAAAVAAGTEPGIGVTGAAAGTPMVAGSALPGAGAGATAASAAGVDPIGIGATTPTSVSPTDLAGSVTGAMQPSTSGILSSLSGAYQAAKGPLSVASNVSTLYSLANKILGPQAEQGIGPVAPLPGGNYTTAQAGAYGAGPLGSEQLGATTFNPQTGRYGGYYTPRGQQGSLGSASETLLG